MTLPHSLPPAFRSMRAENGSADKRWTDGEILMTGRFLPLIFDEAIVPHTLNGDTHYKAINTNSVRQTKTFFVLPCFPDFLLAAYLFNFLHGRRGLPYLRLFIPANRLVAFCLQVTHPEVTFNSSTKKMCGHALWHRLSA